jgi:small subunit ribosomal protein S21
MLIVNVDNKTPIEKALKLFKSKVIKTKLMTELKKRKEFTKKSIVRRSEIKKAVYNEKLRFEKFD